MPTGSRGLDIMRGGGIPRGATVYLCGGPGSGKTVLAQQMAYSVAAAGEQVMYLYLSSFSESNVKRIKALQGFEFFDPAAYNVQVRYVDLEPVLRAQQIQDVASYLTNLLEQNDPNLVVVDSMKGVVERFEHQAAAMSAFMAIAEFAAKNNRVALLVGEYGVDEIGKHREFALTDGIILLTANYQSPDGKRYLRIAKMRGVNHISEAKSFIINTAGVQIEPS